MGGLAKGGADTGKLAKGVGELATRLAKGELAGDILVSGTGTALHIYTGSCGAAGRK